MGEGGMERGRGKGEQGMGRGRRQSGTFHPPARAN